MADAEVEIETLSVDDAKALLGAEDVVLVDLRDPRELERVRKTPGVQVVKGAAPAIGPPMAGGSSPSRVGSAVRRSTSSSTSGPGLLRAPPAPQPRAGAEARPC